MAHDIALELLKNGIGELKNMKSGSTFRELPVGSPKARCELLDFVELVRKTSRLLFRSSQDYLQVFKEYYKTINPASTTVAEIADSAGAQLLYSNYSMTGNRLILEHNSSIQNCLTCYLATMHEQDKQRRTASDRPDADGRIVFLAQAKESPLDSDYDSDLSNNEADHRVTSRPRQKQNAVRMMESVPIRPKIIRDFDDYSYEPSDGDTESVAQNFLQSNAISPKNRTTEVVYRDTGKRLYSDFFWGDALYEPVEENVREMVLPIPDSIPDRSSPAATDNSVSMTLTELMSLPPDEVWKNLTLVTGRMNNDNKLAIDLTNSFETLVRDDIALSLDIDSLIVVSHTLAVKTPLLCSDNPVSVTPPIDTNNHVCVNVLEPCTASGESDGQVPGRRFRRARYKLSQIPAMTFGSSGSFVKHHILFPRMITKSGKYYSKGLSWKKQDLFYREVLVPAHQLLSDQATGPYIFPKTIREYLSNKKKVIIPAEQCTNLIHLMRSVIEDKMDEVGMFGSFFFVSDIRGAKLATITSFPLRTAEDASPEAKGVLEKFRAANPDLDWDFISDPTKCAAYVDVGVNLNPIKKNVVGLWHHSFIEASNMKAGTCSTKKHLAAHMSGYGGCEADFPSERAHRAHLFRIIHYMLTFECFRVRAGVVLFPSDADTFRMDSKAQEIYRKNKTLLEEQSAHPRGVRCEIRTSLYAVESLLEVLPMKVGYQCYLSS